MKRTLTLLSAFALLLSTMVLPAAASSHPTDTTPSLPMSDGGITPYILDNPGPGGNVFCSALGFNSSSDRVNLNGSFDGDFPDGIVVGTDGTYVSWTSTFDIGAVIVKGGPAANVYDYREDLSRSDSGLASPNGAGLSNLTFCWDDDATTDVNALLSGRKIVEGVTPLSDLLAGFEIVIYEFDDSSPTVFTEVASTTTGTDALWAIEVGPYSDGDVVSLAVCESPRDDWAQTSPEAGDAGTIVGPEGTACYLVSFTAGSNGIPLFAGLDFTNDTESLSVTKTAVTSFVRTHDWTVSKSVETEEGFQVEDEAKIWLYTDGSGDESASWTVTTTYLGYEDHDFQVSGTITITNDGPLATSITSVTDELLGLVIMVDCGVEFPHSLEAGSELTCTYLEELDDDADGINTVTVTTSRDNDYTASATVEWFGPDDEINADVTVVDDSDLFDEVRELGEGPLQASDFDEGDSATFSYQDDFGWDDFEQCGSNRYTNTASVLGDGDMTLASATAALRVNVQCFEYETAYAQAAYSAEGTWTEDEDLAHCFIPTFSNWGWTNGPIASGTTATWPLYAGAAQCDTDRGTLVGTVELSYGAGGFEIEYDIFDGFDLEETHTYAGSDEFPQVQRGRRTVDTVAPGQYYIDVDGGPIFIIAHAVVGIPDPSFGPE